MAKKKAKKASARGSAAKRSKASDQTPTYFLSLTVQNVRCFGANEQTLDLSDGNERPAQWTVILGNNGTGKTTLLESVVGFDVVRTEAHPPRDVLRFVDWIQLGRPHHFVRIDGPCTARLAAKSVSGVRWTGTEASFAHPTLHEVEIAIGGETGWQQHGDPGRRALFAYGASRRMSASGLGGSELNGCVESLFDDRAELVNAEEWLLQLDYSASKPSTIQERQAERFQQVKDLLIRILPDVTDVRFSVPHDERPVPRVEFNTDDGWIPLPWLGYGYRTLIAWMVDFASRMVERYPDSKDPLAEPAVVLVDEIDLHLHPKWQRSLMTYLNERFPNTQFIVTAHSPLFVQAAAGANLVVLRRDKKKGHVIIDNDVQAIRGWRLDQVVTSDLFGLETARPPALDKLLKERTKILCKPKLTKADEKKLAQLDEQIGPLPGGETAEDARTRLLLEKTLRVLEKKGSRPD